MTRFTIGCDPEIFIIDGKGNPVSAHGLIEGTKEKPFPVSSGAYQVDGMAVEFNTDPVVHSDFNGFNQRVIEVIGQLKAAVKKNNKQYKFFTGSVLDFPKEYFDSLPDSVKELGCDPDYNAYTMEENPRPDGERLFRTAAGHIHVGWGADIPVDNEEHLEICASFVKMLDATVGLLMTVIDQEPRRRELYGKAGAFRPKSYGVEYRTPSNAWIFSKPARHEVHQAVNRAISYMRQGHSIEGLTGVTPEVLQKIINEGDRSRAINLLRLHQNTTNLANLVASTGAK